MSSDLKKLEKKLLELKEKRKKLRKELKELQQRDSEFPPPKNLEEATTTTTTTKSPAKKKPSDDISSNSSSSDKEDTTIKKKSKKPTKSSSSSTKSSSSSKSSTSSKHKEGNDSSDFSDEDEVMQDADAPPKKLNTGSRLKDQINKAKLAMNIDCCFLIDCTKSMDMWIEKTRTSIKDIVKLVKDKFPSYSIRLSFVGYRDYHDKKPFETLDFTEDTSVFEKFLSKVIAEGGGDIAEDVIGGLAQVTALNWKSTIRILFHIADAAAHGVQFNDYKVKLDNYLYAPPKDIKVPDPKAVFGALKANDINNYFFIRINNDTDKMIREFKKMYDDASNNIALVEQHLGQDVSKFLTVVVESISASVSKANIKIQKK